jgi:hypothetical protein
MFMQISVSWRVSVMSKFLFDLSKLSSLLKNVTLLTLSNLVTKWTSDWALFLTS